MNAKNTIENRHGHQNLFNVSCVFISDNSISQWTWSNNIPFVTDPFPAFDNLDGQKLIDTDGLNCLNLFTGGIIIYHIASPVCNVI